jgi:hypothetical protein
MPDFRFLVSADLRNLLQQHCFGMSMQYTRKIMAADMLRVAISMAIVVVVTVTV